MLDWLANNGILLALTLAGASYFGFYVSAARGRRSEPAGRRRREKDC
jgi:hypothetical protein